MHSPEQLAALLRTANVEELSKASQVCTKTIYRLRHQTNSPNMATVRKLLDGLQKLTATHST